MYRTPSRDNAVPHPNNPKAIQASLEAIIEFNGPIGEISATA
jgi:hypothetical protein